jgi:putative transcriptional regulator
MSDVYESIKKGLEEAIAFSQGNKNGTKIHKIPIVNVRKLRLRVGATQSEFATAFGVSLGTLRRWENGEQSPRGPALVLLNLLKKEPQTFSKVFIK